MSDGGPLPHRKFEEVGRHRQGKCATARRHGLPIKRLLDYENAGRLRAEVHRQSEKGFGSREGAVQLHVQRLKRNGGILKQTTPDTEIKHWSNPKDAASILKATIVETFEIATFQGITQVLRYAFTLLLIKKRRIHLQREDMKHVIHFVPGFRNPTHTTPSNGAEPPQHENKNGTWQKPSSVFT